MDGEEYRRAVEGLDREWGSYERLAVSNLVAYRACELAEKHALRGFDAVHLASALRLAEHFKDLSFLAFDERLTNAARDASMPVYGEDDTRGGGADG